MPRLRMLHCGLLLAGCCSGLLVAGCSGNPPGLSDIEGTFIRAAHSWDLNRDGKVTCEEWRTYAASLFKEADSDHDGKLTGEEFAKLPKIDRLFEVANFDYYDVNRQGYVTQADFVDRPNPAFAALDHDKSCVIYSDQLRAIELLSGDCAQLYPNSTQVLPRLACILKPSSNSGGGSSGQSSPSPSKSRCETCGDEYCGKDDKSCLRRRQNKCLELCSP